MTKPINLLSSMAGFLTVALCSVMVLVASLMLVATVYSADYTIHIAFGYLFSLLTVWCAFEHLSKAAAVFARHEPLTLMLFCFFVHFVFIRVLPSLGQNGMAQYSDAVLPFIAQKSGHVCFLHKSYISYWCNYEIILSVLGLLFGHGFCVGQFLNAICCVLVLLPMYKIAEEISGRRMARFSVLAMGLSPTVIMYSTTYTGEFLAAVLMFYAAYFMLKGYASGNSMSGGAAEFTMFGGCLLGLAYLFKPITILLVLALAFYLGVSLMSFFNMRNFVRSVFVLLIVLGVSSGFRHVGQSSLSALVERSAVKITEFKGSGIMYELALGLNLEKDGTYSRKLAHRLNAMDAAQQRAFVWDSIKKDWRRYPALMVRKFIGLHGSPTTKGGSICVFAISFNSVGNGKKQNFTPPWVTPLTHSETLVNRVLFLLGFCGMMLRSVMNRRAPFEYVFFAAVVLAFTLLEQLIEGHGRYKMALYPFYFVSVPYIGVLFTQCVKLWPRMLRFVRPVASTRTHSSRISCLRHD